MHTIQNVIAQCRAYPKIWIDSVDRISLGDMADIIDRVVTGHRLIVANLLAHLTTKRSIIASLQNDLVAQQENNVELHRMFAETQDENVKLKNRIQSLEIMFGASDKNNDLGKLVFSFSVVLYEKLMAKRDLYGNAWMRKDWHKELVDQLHVHLADGDPIDTAAFCAFAWHHGYPLYWIHTTPISEWKTHTSIEKSNGDEPAQIQGSGYEPGGLRYKHIFDRPFITSNSRITCGKRKGIVIGYENNSVFAKYSIKFDDSIEVEWVDWFLVTKEEALTVDVTVPPYIVAMSINTTGIIEVNNEILNDVVKASLDRTIGAFHFATHWFDGEGRTIDKNLVYDDMMSSLSKLLCKPSP